MTGGIEAPGPERGRRLYLPLMETAATPELTTERLLLRGFSMSDAPAVAELCADRAIWETTLVIPHPYHLSDAQGWIATHTQAFSEGRQVNWALTLKETDGSRDAGTLVGAMSLMIQSAHRCAELGYWVGRPYWNLGFATEAARAVVRFGFEQLDLNRIHAHHLNQNPSSGRVMEKVGMQREGLARQMVIKDGTPRDCVLYAILQSDVTGL